MPPVIKEKKNAVASDTLKPDASVNSSSLPLTHISGTLHMIQSLDETDPPEFEAKKGNERDKELHMKVSTGEVQSQQQQQRERWHGVCALCLCLPVSFLSLCIYEPRRV